MIFEIHSELPLVGGRLTDPDPDPRDSRPRPSRRRQTRRCRGSARGPWISCDFTLQYGIGHSTYGEPRCVGHLIICYPHDSSPMHLVNAPGIKMPLNAT